jgi:hypothetical protein
MILDWLLMKKTQMPIALSMVEGVRISEVTTTCCGVGRRSSIVAPPRG